LRDKSDWWSVNNENFPDLKLPPRNTGLDNRNFQIAGVDLNKLDFESVAAKLGAARLVERGDASSGREQACYVSDGNSKKVFLIFEGAEGEEGAFYLFTGGQDWTGSKLCAKSAQVSERLSTESGLKLGLSRAQLESVVGKPDLASGDRLVYSRVVKKRASPEEFERSRREYPETLSDKRAHEMFDFFTVDMRIEARLTDSRVGYLAVMTTVLD